MCLVENGACYAVLKVTEISVFQNMLEIWVPKLDFLEKWLVVNDSFITSLKKCCFQTVNLIN